VIKTCHELFVGFHLTINFTTLAIELTINNYYL